MGARRFLAVILLAACAHDPAPSDADPTTDLELFSWWTAPGEAEALDVLVSAHHAEFPDVTLSNIVVTNVGRAPADLLHQRLLGDADNPPSPPDLMQYNVESVYDDFGRFGVTFEPLDELFAQEGWTDKFNPEILSKCVVDGHIVMMPVGVHRQPSFLFAKQVLADTGASVPTDWHSFKAACDTITAAGKTCVAVTQENWVQNILFQGVAIMTMGPRKYYEYFSGQGDREDPGIAEAVANYDFVLDHYVGGRGQMRAQGWDEAAKDLFRGDAAFDIHGDWAVGLFKALGWNDQDFGVTAMPGGGALFMYDTDAFMIPTGSGDLAPKLDVLRAFGAASTLSRFAEVKGASPPRVDADVSSDPLAAGAYSDLLHATYAMPTPAANPDATMFAGFIAKSIDQATLTEAYRQSIYPK